MSEAQQFYQAIGDIFATLVIVNDGTKFLETQEARYRAFVPLKAEKRYLDKYQGQQVYWRVYPQFKEQELSFQIVSLAERPKKGHGQFILQGDWIESGQLQIWRNADAGRINKYNWRPRLLPVSWENAPLPDASFWQLQAELVDGTLKIVTAQGPFPRPLRLEKPPELNTQRQRSGPPLPKAQLQPRRATTESIRWEELAPVSGKLDLIVKINTLPQVLKANGQCHFKIDCDGRVFQVSVKPKQWAKLETASTTYAQWVAAIAGKLGAATVDGFVLEEANIQVFERGSKQNEPQTEAAASQQSEVKNELGAKAEVESSQTKTKSIEQPNPLAGPTAVQAQAKPKRIGKFNVEVLKCGKG